MAGGFKSGTIAIPNGAYDISATGLSIGFTPTVVSVSVRQPSSDADIITAYVSGTPTSDGFTALLSSPTTRGDYILDWTAFSDGISPSPIAGDTLAVSYTELKNSVARFLGYDANNLTEDQVVEIDECIQDGIRQFYYPPRVDGVEDGYEWSFLRQNGSVVMSAGVSDYLLPDGFGRINGQLTFTDSEARTAIPVIPYGDIERMIHSPAAEVGRPRFAAILSQSVYGSKGQKKKIYFYPTPDKNYGVAFVCDSDTGKIDASNRPFPLGGPMFASLVKESCLSMAEQMSNDEVGAHTAKFQQLLASMVSKDRNSGAQVYGFYGDNDFERW